MQTLGKVQTEYRIQIPYPNFPKQQEKPGQAMDNGMYQIPLTLIKTSNSDKKQNKTKQN